MNGRSPAASVDPASALHGKRVLVADDDPIHARVLKQAFLKAGAIVDVVGDGSVAREHLAHGGYDAFITDWMMPEIDGIELARQLKRAGRGPYVVLVSALSIPDARTHALQAGAQEFFAKPFIATKLLSAVGVALSRRAASPGASSAPLPEPAGGGMDHPVGRTPSWKALPETIRQVAADLLQTRTAIAPLFAAPADAVLRCVLPLVDSEHLMEMHFRLEASRETAMELAQTLLGEPQDDEATLQDLLAEFANVASGALKTAFSKEGFPFTLGLPSKAQTGGANVAAYGISTALAVRTDKMSFFVTVGVQPRNAQSVPSHRLSEGMVLAESLHTPAGALVLPIGTRLTASVTDRLHKMFRDRSVLVCMPDVAP